jgi:hypothetical protein
MCEWFILLHMFENDFSNRLCKLGPGFMLERQLRRYVFTYTYMQKSRQCYRGKGESMMYLIALIHNHTELCAHLYSFHVHVLALSHRTSILRTSNSKQVLQYEDLFHIRWIHNPHLWSFLPCDMLLGAPGTNLFDYVEQIPEYFGADL